MNEFKYTDVDIAHNDADADIKPYNNLVLYLTTGTRTHTLTQLSDTNTHVPISSPPGSRSSTMN